MRPRRLGFFMVLCAPSGTGKSTLARKLCAEFDNLSFSISATTRPPRDGETNGRDYHFLTPEEFAAWRDSGRLAEWAQVHGHLYGTPLLPLRESLASGRDVIFDIDVQGAAQLRQSLGSGAYVFILPPSRAELSRRLSARGTESPESVAKRMVAARGELEAAHLFDYWVENVELEAAYADLRAIYLAERRRPRLHPELVRDLLDQWNAAI